jgi:hypothetical protein
MASDDNGQPSLDKLASEGVSIRKCIASGEQYGAGPGVGGSPAKAGSKPQGALASMRMKGKGY